MAGITTTLGIEAHGLKWKFTLPIKVFIPQVPNIQEDEAHEYALILQRVLERTAKRPIQEIPEFPDIEWDLVETREELLDALNLLYDWADYYRILIY